MQAVSTERRRGFMSDAMSWGYHGDELEAHGKHLASTNVKSTGQIQLPSAGGYMPRAFINVCFCVCMHQSMSSLQLGSPFHVSHIVYNIDSLCQQTCFLRSLQVDFASCPKRKDTCNVGRIKLSSTCR